MQTTEERQIGIQITLFDYFMDVDSFTLDEAVEAVKKVKEVKEPSIRARIYEGIDKGIFKRISKGIYTVTRKNSKNEEVTALLINGNGRDLSQIENESIDGIITDHPYDIANSLEGRNRKFADYERFKYNDADFKEKARVLKPGCFLIEFLPEENQENYEYLYSVKKFAKNNGLEYYAKVAWKKGDFVANTGRKSKNMEDILFFTKGKCRKLRLDAQKNKEMIKDYSVLHYVEEWNDICESNKIIFDLIILKEDCETAEKELHNAYENWIEECDNSILISSGFTRDELLQIPIGNYMLMWLEKKIEYIDITDEREAEGINELSEKEQNEMMLSLIKKKAPEKLKYMSGTNGMLPTVFDISPVLKKEKVHQAEKPLELLEKIIDFTTLPKEKLLDQFAGSFSLSKAALEMDRDSISIEINEDYYNNEIKRLKENNQYVESNRMHLPARRR